MSTSLSTPLSTPLSTAATGVLTPELELRLGTAVERMPAFPRSVQQILDLTRRVDCLPKQLVEVLEKDPVMTVKILKVINSAYYGLPNRITSVGHAVVYLGLNTIKNLALGFAAVGILPRTNSAGFDVQRYLLHSLVVAGTARQLATQLHDGTVEPGDCYIAGLLHDFGKIVFAEFLAGDFLTALAYMKEHQVPLHVAEQIIIGVDHAAVGAMLAVRWQFPDHLVACIRDHHNFAQPPSPMIECLRLADQIVRYYGIGDSGNPWHRDEAPVLPQALLDAGVTDVESAAKSVHSFEKIVADAGIFAHIGSEN